MAATRERSSAHDPGRVLRDVAVMLADGGDCVTDLAAYAGQERLFGARASETTTHRVLKSVGEPLLERIHAARAAARARIWDAGARPRTITLNVDATLVAAHAEKERAAGTDKHGFGFHPICCYLDETGEPLAAILRPANAGSNTAADHFAVLALALDQLPAADLDREILVRADSGGATQAFAAECRDAREVADGGCDRHRDRHVDAGDRHQPPRVRAAQRDPRQLGVDQPQLVAVEVQLAQQRRDRAARVGRQLLLGQPGPALAPEQVGGRAARHEVAMQDRLHLVLQARALAHQVRAARDLPAPRLRLLVGDPHARQVVAGQQLREDLGVDLVGLGLGLGDRPRLLP